MTGTATRGGVNVASEVGLSVTYGLLNAQGRSDTSIDTGAMVFQGLIATFHLREEVPARD